MKRFYKHGYGLLPLIFILVIFGLSEVVLAKSDQPKPNKESTSKSEDPSTVDAKADLAIDTAPSTEAPAGTANSCFNESFQIPSSEAKPVDVLFVVETSSSMSDIRQKVIDGVADFVSKLPTHSDFNIAVMLSHGSTSNFSGKLYQVEGEPLVLKTSQLSQDQIRTYLNAKLLQVPMDADAGGGEEGIFSLFKGITTPNLLAEIQGADFFRANAALSIVFIADRRDICANVSVGVPEETDPIKIAARIRDCEGLTAGGLASRLAQLKGTQPLLVSGIIYSRDPAPLGKEIGYGYTDVISLNRGFAVDIAQDDISAGLAPIIVLGGQTSPGQDVFTLNRADVDSATLKVTVNGQEVPFNFDGAKITVTTPIPQGATVVASYCLKAENPFVGLCEIYENADQWSSWSPAASSQDLQLKNKSGNHAIGAVRNLLIENVSGKLHVESAMAVSAISSVSGNSHFRVVGDIGSISNVSGSVRIDKAGNVGSVSTTKGSFQMNAMTLSSYTNGSGNACVRAESIGKIQSMNGNKTFIATTIEELSAASGAVHVYGAEIKYVTNTAGKICLHNGATVLNSSGVTGFIGICEEDSN